MSEVVHSCQSWLATYHESLSTIGAAVVAVGGGVIAYHRQKQYETLQQRFLQGGVDAVANQVQMLHSTFFTNYERTLGILKCFREMEQDMPRELLDDKVFIPLGPDAFDIAPHYRLRRLVQSNVFHDVYQLYHAFVGGSISFMMYDLRSCVRLQLGPSQKLKVIATPSEIDRQYFEEMVRRNGVEHQFSGLQHALQVISDYDLRSFTFLLR